MVTTLDWSPLNTLAVLSPATRSRGWRGTEVIVMAWIVEGVWLHYDCMHQSLSYVLVLRSELVVELALGDGTQGECVMVSRRHC